VKNEWWGIIDWLSNFVVFLFTIRLNLLIHLLTFLSSNILHFISMRERNKN
jgi:hypothetical protein